MGTQSTNDIVGKFVASTYEDTLFERGYISPAQAELEFDDLMQRVKSIFKPSVLIGSLGLWNGRCTGYKYCRDFDEFLSAISDYNNVIIRQVGTQLCITLVHHDGRHEMELRRLTDYGNEHMDGIFFDYYNEKALDFINHNTESFGYVPTKEEYALRDIPF